MNLKDKMDLLGIQDVTTNRQHRNGTVVWRLPIKNNNSGKTFIEVASFSTGYVRNQNSGYSNYQLNKRCDGEPEYFQLNNGDYRKYTTRSCKLIPNEIDRLEYLIGYCLRNYYVKRANEVVNGDFIPKWSHEYDLRKQQEKMEEICHIDANHEFVINELQNKLANSVPKWKYDEVTRWKLQDRGHYDRIQELEEKLDEANNQIKKLDDFYEASNTFNDSMYEGRNDRIKELESDVHNLENKLATIERIANDRNKWNG